MSHLIYFRILGYIITITLHVCNIIIMINSFHGEPMKNKVVRQFSEMQCFFFTCWTFTVCSLFWAFFFYDRSLFFPKDIDLVITKTSNHIMHTFILVASLWEVIFRSREAPKSHKWHLLGVYMVAVVYISVVFIIHAIKGVWVYPIFDVLAGSVYLYLFYVFLFVYLPIEYYIQWGLNYAIWNSREKNRKLC